jgi:hypothetical protein
MVKYQPWNVNHLSKLIYETGDYTEGRRKSSIVFNNLTKKIDECCYDPTKRKRYAEQQAAMFSDQPEYLLSLKIQVIKPWTKPAYFHFLDELDDDQITNALRIMGRVERAFLFECYTDDGSDSVSDKPPNRDTMRLFNKLSSEDQVFVFWDLNERKRDFVFKNISLERKNTIIEDLLDAQNNCPDPKKEFKWVMLLEEKPKHLKVSGMFCIQCEEVYEELQSVIIRECEIHSLCVSCYGQITLESDSGILPPCPAKHDDKKLLSRK